MKVVLLGASGLVGSRALALLQRHAHPVCCPVRREQTGLQPEDALLPDGKTWSDAVLAQRFRAFAPEAVICCVGTTRRAAGSLEAFAAIDRDLVLRLFAAAAKAGARHAVLVSSVGAEAASRNDYLRIKGDAEQGVQVLGFRRVDLLRPSLLLGTRGESRPLERMGVAASGLVGPLLRGGLRRYRPIAAEAVAAAAVALLSESTPGVFVHEYDGLQALAGTITQTLG